MYSASTCGCMLTASFSASRRLVYSATLALIEATLASAAASETLSCCWNGFCCCDQRRGAAAAFCVLASAFFCSFNWAMMRWMPTMSGCRSV